MNYISVCTVFTDLNNDGVFIYYEVSCQPIRAMIYAYSWIYTILCIVLHIHEYANYIALIKKVQNWVWNHKLIFFNQFIIC